MLILAASTQRTIGVLIAVIILIGFVVYLVLNIRSAKPELGSEIELAPNRKPYYADEDLEGKKLDRSLGMALGLLGVIALTLPLYWLAEPGRQDGKVEGLNRTLTNRGTELYEAFCSNCHGPGGTGGVAAFTITDDTGGFVAQVSWTAPALTTVLTRFDEEEITYILNYGRGVMPAWGVPGGGALTSQQIEELILWMRTIQFTDEVGEDGTIVATAEEQIQEQVMEGVRQGAEQRVLVEDDALAEMAAELEELRADEGDPDEIAALEAELGEALASSTDAYLDEITDPEGDRFAEYGELLFSNEAAAGSFNCARCHTPGWSYGARDDESAAEIIAEWPALLETGILTGYDPGGGWFGWNLTGGSTVRQFPAPSSHEAFIASGSQRGVGYGQAGVGSGQMPGFAARSGDDGTLWPAILTEEQIAAIVEYERNL